MQAVCQYQGQNDPVTNQPRTVMWLKPETVEDHKACQLIVDRFKAGKGLDIGKTWDDHVIIQMPDNPEQEIR